MCIILSINMLYVVATPIGNKEDITLRAVKTLFSVDIILCEDTRTFNIFYDLIRKEDIYKDLPINKNQKIISFHKLNEFEKTPQIINELKEGVRIALVTESGMPCISDPGSMLVKECIYQQIPIKVIPGASSLTTSLAYSGFQNKKVFYIGFFPKNKKGTLEVINIIKGIKKLSKGNMTFIFHESPLRVTSTIKSISEIFTKANFCVCREMTKKFEEIIYFNSKNIPTKTWKGELTIVVEL